MPDKIGSRVRELRLARGMTLTELGRAIGMHNSQLSRYERGELAWRGKTLLEVAQILNVPVDYFYGVPAAEPATEVPVLGRIPAGRIDLAEQDEEGYALAPAEMVKGGDFFYLRVKGDCMMPTIEDGALVLIRKQPDVETGEIAVVAVDDDDATLKRVYWQEEQRTAILRADNPASAPISVEVSRIKVVGKAVSVQHRLDR